MSGYILPQESAWMADATAAPPRLRAWLGGTLAIDTRTLHEEREMALCTELTLYQRKFTGPRQTFAFFHTNDPWLHIPKGYPLARPNWLRLCDVRDNRSDGFPLPEGAHAAVTFGVPPWPTGQPMFIETMVAGARANGHGGLVLAPTRSGKTLCALEAACRLGRSTLVLVDRGPVMRQWIDAIARLRTGAGEPIPCGVIQEDRFDLPPHHPFVVAMLQTIARRNLSDEVRRAFGTVILDECATAPCDTVWGAMSRIESRYVFGLSATPDRKDGLEAAIRWIVGPPVANLYRKLDADVHWLRIPYRACASACAVMDDAGIPTGEVEEVAARLSIGGRTSLVTAEKALAADGERLALLVREAANAREGGRHVLLMVGLREHAVRFAAAFKAFGLAPGLLMGGHDDPHEMTKNPCVATYGLVAKGVDFLPPPTLWIPAGPLGDPRQAMGRVLQPQAPCRPMILDPVDDAPPLLKLARRRARCYREAGFTFRNRI